MSKASSSSSSSMIMGSDSILGAEYVAQLRNLHVLPILTMRDINKDGIKNFLKAFESFQVSHPLARLAEGIAGSAWIFLSATYLDGVNILTVTNSELASKLATVFGPRDVVQVQNLLQDIRMSHSAVLVNLDCSWDYVVQWTEIMQTLNTSNRPTNKEMRAVFVRNISPQGLLNIMATHEKSLSRSSAVELLFPVLVQKTMDILKSQDVMVNMRSAEEDRIKLKKGSSNIVEEKTVAKLNKSTKKRDRVSVNKVEKVVKSVKFAKTEPGSAVCWGCGHAGHTRNKCPHKDKQGFKAYPEKQLQPLRIK